MQDYTNSLRDKAVSMSKLELFQKKKKRKKKKRNVRIDPVLPELADKIFDELMVRGEPEVGDESEVGVSVVSETNVAGKQWKSYVVLKRAETTPLESHNCTRMYPTCELSLQALVVDLETRLEAKELEAYRLATEKRYQAGDADETDEAGDI